MFSTSASTFRRPTRHGARGFTLIEALIALLVVAFGMLAIAGFQTSLNLSSDLARQRAEAVRLAQQQIEAYRAFETVPTHTTKFDYTADVVTKAAEVFGPGQPSPRTLTGNTDYSRTVTVTPITISGSDIAKQVNVAVTWTDRSGTTQTVSMFTVISRSDPYNIGTLATGPGGTSYRRPKNRNINIPYPAVSVSGNRSAFQPPGSSKSFVFDNVTGNIVGYCTGTLVEGDTVTFGSGGCTAVAGYLLSGYVRFREDWPSNSNNTFDLRGEWDEASMPLNASTPLSIDFSNRGSATTDPTYECYSSQGSSTSGNTTSYFVAYSCIIYPVDHDGATATALRWWGKVTLNPNGWTIGNTSSDWKVCRFTADYDGDGVMTNTEHPLWYRGVTGTLDNQNYVVTQENTCRADPEGTPDPVNGDFVDSSNRGHQPGTGTLSPNEPSTTTTDIPME